MDGALFECFVMSSSCWLVLWVGLWSTHLCPALKTLGGGCFVVFECMCCAVVFEGGM